MVSTRYYTPRRPALVQTASARYHSGVLPSDDELLQLVACLGRLLSLAGPADATGLQRVHLRALAYLRQANRYSNTPGALAAFLGQTKGTVSQSLGVLERRGLVERVRDAADGRQVRLRLTARGRRLAARGGPGDRWARALRRVPAAERIAAAGALRGALVGLQRGGLPSFGQCRSCGHFRRERAGSFRCGLTGEPLRAPETLQICREHVWPASPPRPAPAA